MNLNADPNPVTLTPELLKKCMPFANEGNILRFVNPLNATLIKYQIDTPRRVAAFLAQIAHESGSLKTVVENLNYSAEGLMKIFPKYFTQETAAEYAHKPERIANRVYANRMGNGPEESGDGWKYRGAGLIQCTGKDNFDAIGHALNWDFLTHPEDLQKPGAAALSAGWFWYLKDLNRLADIDAFEKITRRINGGLNGYEDRLKHWENCKKALNVES